jgi:6-phosphofructokinase 1
VIGAATIRAALSGYDVVGILDGFSRIKRGHIEHVRPLTINDVSRIHFRGGSFLGISRANPTKSPELLEQTVVSLLRLEVDKLITIGGDDTAFSASRIEQESKGALRVVHVPKTIDNDLDLPNNTDTFGFQTARHIGVQIVENLMVDARTTSRWYFVIAMGRKAGHLALGIGKAAGVTMTLIPEEFPAGPVRLKTIVDTLVGGIVKRLASGRPDGVAVLAEGLVERMDESDLEGLAGVERDAHNNVRIAEIAFGEILKHAVQRRLAEFKVKTTIVPKNIGYELRCADPIPYDMDYARDLGYCASKYLIEGGSTAMVSITQGTFRAVPFENIMDRKTGRVCVRMVDITSDRYMIARRYMLRLRQDDFEDPSELAKFANVLGISLDEFREEFAYLVEHEPIPRMFYPEDALLRPSVAAPRNETE